MRFDTVVFVTILGLLGSVHAALPGCKPKAKSCSAVPRATASACSSIFVKSKIKVATCTSQSTKTVVKTVCPTITKTLTAYKTVKVNKPDVTTTETETILSVSTFTDTATTDSTATVTSISTSYSYTYPGATCTPIVDKRALEWALNKRAAANVPKCCSCLLTSTKVLPVKYTTKTVTSKHAKKTAKKTVTKTITVKKYLDGKVVTETDSTTSTMVKPQTITSVIIASTKTETAVTSVTTTHPDLCVEPMIYSGRDAFEYYNAIYQDAQGVNNLSACCLRCYFTKNCANYRFDTNGNTCEIAIYGPPNIPECRSDVCESGRAFGYFDPQPENELYGVGPCGGTIVR